MASANDAIFNSYSIPTISTAASIQAECICRYPKCKPPRRKKTGEGCHAQPCVAQVVPSSRHTITTTRLGCIYLQRHLLLSVWSALMLRPGSLGDIVSCDDIHNLYYLRRCERISHRSTTACGNYNDGPNLFREFLYSSPKAHSLYSQLPSQSKKSLPCPTATSQ
jgi:hypothetical protein